MKKKNELKIIIPIIIIVLLLTIGFSYAYFAAEVTGSEDKTTITAAGGVMNIDYDGGPELTANDIVPSDNPFTSKTFTVTGNNNSQAPMYYKINLMITSNTFSNDAIKYKLVSVNTDNSGEVALSDTILKDIKSGSSLIILGIGNFTSPTDGNKAHTYNLELYFPNQEYDQKNDLNKSINAQIEIVGIEPPLRAKILAQGGGVEAITAKGTPNFNTIAPTILTYKELTSNYTSTLSSSSDRAIGTGYIFNEANGTYSLTNYQVGQTYAQEHIGRYTCASSSYLNCSNMYKINTVTGTAITNSIRYQSEANTLNYADTGLYAAEDEYGTSYYYRGDKEKLNNNLIWAGFQWKIVRINGDGSIRIVYNGTESQFNENKIVNSLGSNTQILNIPWNEKHYKDAKYVGYMYGGENGAASTQRDGNVSEAATYNETNTNVKTNLDNWYKLNILDKGHSDLVVDNLFCNDRQLGSGLGYGNTSTVTYAFYSRTKSPILKCTLKNDRFTTNDTLVGNGALTYPVGLLSSDETTIAGLNYGTSSKYNYLNTDAKFWLFTPRIVSPDNYTHVCLVDISGQLTNSNVTSLYGVRPTLSISLIAEAKGNGSATSPFIIK